MNELEMYKEQILPDLRIAEVIAQPFINQVLHSDFLKNELPDKCAKLIIADPPYFEVKGEFDFIWKSFHEYLKDVEQWAIECKRILADGGTLLWYGHAKKIAYTQIILDKIFTIENNIARMKQNLTSAMVLTGKRKFKTGLFSFSVRPSVSTVIDNADAVPDEFVRIKREPDKTAIKKTIQDGKEITFAHLEEKEGVTWR